MWKIRAKDDRLVESVAAHFHMYILINFPLFLIGLLFPSMFSRWNLEWYVVPFFTGLLLWLLFGEFLLGGFFFLLLFNPIIIFLTIFAPIVAQERGVHWFVWEETTTPKVEIFKKGDRLSVETSLGRYFDLFEAKRKKENVTK